jgi:hypothetical protein
MNTSEFLVTRGKGTLEGSSMFARMFTIEGRREQLKELARAGEQILRALQRFDGFGGCWSSPTTRTARYL